MEMRDRLPGHELLMLPGQTQLVLHEKFEAAEFVAGFVEDVSLKTPNTYSLRSPDGVTYFVLKEEVAKNSMAVIAYRTMVDKFCCAKKLIKKDFKFNVINAMTGEQVAVIDSPPALDDDCCGLVCGAFCGCCPAGACWSMRSATWTPTAAKEGQDEPSVLAMVQKRPLYNPCCCIGDGLGGDCMNARFDITFPGDDKLEPIHMYRDFCAFSRNPIKLCFTCSCDDSDMVMLSPSGIELKPGTGEGHSSHSASILGRLWKDWDDTYKPTTGNDAIQGRYPQARKARPTSFKEGAKMLAGDIARGHAASYLIELPRDDVEQKVGLVAASVLYEMVFGRDSGRIQWK
jgi:hypothetical protein